MTVGKNILSVRTAKENYSSKKSRVKKFVKFSERKSGVDY